MKPFQKPLLLAFGLLLALAIGEIFTRFVFPEYSGLIYRADPRSGLITYVPGAKSFHRSSCFFEETKINSLGWRDSEFAAEKSPDVYRILVLGDSFTAALEMPLGKAFHSLLEDKLNESFKTNKFEVISLGRGNTGTYYYYRYLKDFGLKYQPDLVLVMSFVNDPTDDIRDLQNPREGKIYSLDENGNIVDDYALETARWKLFIKTNIRKLALARFLYDNLDLDRFRSGLKNEPRTAEDVFGNMNRELAYKIESKLVSEMKRMTDEAGAALILISVPYRKQVLGSENPEEPYYFSGYSHEEALAKLAEENDLDFLNLLPIFRKNYFRDRESFDFTCDQHWNGTGHRWAAEAIYEFLRDKI